MGNARKFIIKLLPPVLYKFFRHLSAPTARQVENVNSAMSFYGDPDIHEVVVRKGVDYDCSEADIHASQMLQVSLLLLALARIKKTGYVVADFGGGAGQYYQILARLLGQKTKLCWNVVETPELVRKAKSHALDSDGRHFFTNMSCVGQVDVVYANCSLCYVFDLDSVLTQIKSVGAEYLVISRMPLSLGDSVTLMQKSYLFDHGPGKLVNQNGLANKKVTTPLFIHSKKTFEKKLGELGEIITTNVESTAAFFSRNASFDTYGFIVKLTKN